MTTKARLNGKTRLTEIPRYLAITEVPRAESRRLEQGKSIFDGVYDEMVLRLEQTSETKALRLEFEDEYTAKRVKAGLGRLFRKRNGNGFVSLAQRGTVVFVARGKNWMK